jgi:hypothetical protein
MFLKVVTQLVYQIINFFEGMCLADQPRLHHPETARVHTALPYQRVPYLPVWQHILIF